VDVTSPPEIAVFSVTAVMAVVVTVGAVIVVKLYSFP
jgi:hypothetical protein